MDLVTIGLIALVVVSALILFATGKSRNKKEEVLMDIQPLAPYKVEAAPAPEPKKCGCGRSESGLCVGLHNLTPEQWAINDSNPNRVIPVAVPAVVETPAVVKSAKPAKPRAKVVEKTTKPVKTAEKKPVAKKSATKPAAIKAPAKKAPAKVKKAATK